MNYLVTLVFVTDCFLTATLAGTWVRAILPLVLRIADGVNLAELSRALNLAVGNWLRTKCR